MPDKEEENSAAPFESEQVKRRAQRLSYPTTGDSRGLARCNWKGKTYSFGEHNSESSWLRFSAWRADLLETGDAKPVRSIRIDAAHDREPMSQTGLSPSTVAVLALASVVALVLGAGGTALMMQKGSPEIPSSSIADAADGTSMSPKELAVIRGMRLDQAYARTLKAKNQERASELLTQFLKDGIPDEPTHLKVHHEAQKKIQARLTHVRSVDRRDGYRGSVNSRPSDEDN